MTFETVMKSIFPVPEGTVEPTPFWRDKPGASTSSVQYWDHIDQEPRSSYWKEYEMVHCTEHRRKEAVPIENYYSGLLSAWYKAGLHPRFPIWTTVRKHYPNFRRTWLMRLLRDTDRSNKLLRKYKTDPDGFAEAVMDAVRGWQIVPLRTAAGNFRVRRDFRDRFRRADFTVAEFIATANQLERRLMLLSRSFAVTEVLSSLHLLAKDEEGEVYGDVLLTNWSDWNPTQHYLHVVCATTGEHYLLGIPPRVNCAICGEGTPHLKDDHNSKWTLAWTPAAARRWTFGLDEDVVFVQEA